MWNFATRIERQPFSHYVILCDKDYPRFRKLVEVLAFLQKVSVHHATVVPGSFSPGAFVGTPYFYIQFCPYAVRSQNIQPHRTVQQVFHEYLGTDIQHLILELYNKLLDIVYTPDISKAVPIRMSDDWKQGQYIVNANGHVVGRKRYFLLCHFLSRTPNLFIVLTDLYGLFLPVNYCGDSFTWLHFFWIRIDGFQQINIFWYSLSRNRKR